MIDGLLSRELKYRLYEEFGRSDTSAVRRARNAHQATCRIKGCDFTETSNQTDATFEVVRKLGLNPTDRIRVSGAWYDPTACRDA